VVRSIQGTCQPLACGGKSSILLKETFAQRLEIIFQHSLYEALEALMCDMTRQLHRNGDAIWVFASFAAAEQKLRTKALDDRYMDSCRATYRAACEHYIRTELGDIYRAPPTLARKTERHCSICSVHLNPFLSSTSEREKKFFIKAAEREHIKTKLPCDGIKTDIDKRGAPHRLIVEKTRTRDDERYPI